ncbi:hypothetical protein GF354_01070 [Candidatus Peregrinibacteria bacterium]|nr:hypothetical protein [Candidatus Peregrinibacteria bacterium]
MESKVFVIGASTGGPDEIKTILKNIPSDFSGTLIIVQHLLDDFSENFAKWLDKYSNIPVEEALDGEKVMQGKAYVAPTGYHLAITNKDDSIIFKLETGETISGFIPSIDVLFTSAAKAVKQNLTAIILSGMGYDSIKGAKLVKKFGGAVIVQAPPTCILDTMPKNIIKNKLFDEICVPELMGSKIYQINNS